MDNVIIRPMNNQYWTGIGDNLRKRVHIQHIGYIATPQFHWAAVKPLRDIFRIKSGEHHFPSAGIVWDAEGRVKQRQL